MNTGIFGGTFSPVHKGHILAAECFMRECLLDRLYVIPAGIPPHKSVGSGDNPEARLEMTRLAFRDNSDYNKKIFVSDVEIRRGGKSYTYDTLKHFEGEGDLFLLCGTDMLMSFDTWYRFRDIFRMCTVAVCHRYKMSAEEVSSVNEKIDYYRENFGAEIKALGCPPYPVSSTELREIIRSGGEIPPSVPEKVGEFIREEGLYR